MKTSNPIAALFGRSPFKAMQGHMAIVARCMAEVPPMLDALIAGDADGVGRAQTRIFELEKEADDLKNQVRIHLPKGLFMPVDRRDLLEILALQDAIANTAQDIAGLLVTRTMTVPEDMKAPLRELVARCMETFEHSLAIVNELDELVETGFRGPEAKRVEAMVAEIERIEAETDRLGMDLARALFAQEDSLGAVSVVLWDRLIRWIGALADNAQRVGDRLLLLIAR